MTSTSTTLKKSNQIHLRSDESAVAYGAGVVVIFIVFFGLLMIFLSYPMNEFVDSFNDVVAEEDVSKDSTDAFGFNILIFKSLGIILLIGAALWGINRAILVKTGGGGLQ